MSKVNIIRNILGGVWAIEQRYAEAYFPAVYNILNGNVDVVGNEKKNFTSIVNAKHAQVAVTDFSSTQDKNVAIISLKGAIIKYDVECGETGTETIAAMIQNALQSESISAIILDIDSGGGSGDAVQYISQVIKDAKKPIIAYVGNGMSASAAYWIASACDEIYATYETDEIGSIGTYCTIADFKKYYESKGLPIIEVYATESTEKNKPIREALAGNVDYLRVNYIDPFNVRFQNTVKENRKGKLNLADYPEVMKGKLFNANDALKAGLIDGLKSFNDVVNRAFELADQSTKTNTKNSTKTKIEMKKFEKTASLLGLAAFEKTAEGVHISEANMESIENALIAKDTAEASLTTATEKVTAHEATIAANAKTIAEQETKIKELGAAHPGFNANAIDDGAEKPAKKETREAYSWEKKAELKNQ